MKTRPAVFLDRDGVLIEDPGYISSFQQISIIEGAFEAVRELNEAGYLVLVISNQSGVARGYYSLDFVMDTHLLLQTRFRKENAIIDKFYFCPHYSEGTIPEFSIDCDCRKPKPGLINRALKDYNIILNQSYLIGDKITDVRTALNSGLKPVLVKTGQGYGQIGLHHSFLTENQVLIADNLLEATKKILQKHI